MADLSEETDSSGTRSWVFPAVILLVIVVGFGMYALGRRSKAGKTALAPNAATANATPVKTGRRFAPRDTFYLLDYVSAKLPNGVIGFEPGHEVHLVGVHPATQKLVVRDNQAQVEVGPEKLTNDLDIAELARSKDQANQAKIAAYIQQEKEAYDKAQKEGAAKLVNALEKADQKQQENAQRVAQADAQRSANLPSPASGGEPVGTGSKLDEPPVAVGGSSGYGYAGSNYYGSPYSYFGGGYSGGTVSAPAAGGAANPASVGAAGKK